eukprot:5658285-Amphidinium_carterae.1
MWSPPEASHSSVRRSLNSLSMWRYTPPDCQCVCVCARVCVCALVRACVPVRVRACVQQSSGAGLVIGPPLRYKSKSPHHLRRPAI